MLDTSYITTKLQIRFLTRSMLFDVVNSYVSPYRSNRIDHIIKVVVMTHYNQILPVHKLDNLKDLANEEDERYLNKNVSDRSRVIYLPVASKS